MDNLTFTGLLAATPPGGPEDNRAHGGAHTARRLLRPGRRGRKAEGRGNGLRPSAGLRLGHRAAARGPAMEAAAPALLSGLAEKLLRRPPSLRELITLIGYADDYAWFAALVRRLFPDEAEAVLSAPDTRRRVEAFANLFSDRHFPLYAPHLRVPPGRRGRTALVLAAKGHSLPADGLRLRRTPRDVERLPGRHLGNGPAGQALRRLLRRPPTGSGWHGWSRPPSASRRRP